MGTQSARLFSNSKNDNRDIWYQGKAHDKLYKGSQLLWEKKRGKNYFITTYSKGLDWNPNTYERNCLRIIYTDTKSCEEHGFYLYPKSGNYGLPYINTKTKERLRPYFLGCRYVKGQYFCLSGARVDSDNRYVGSDPTAYMPDGQNPQNAYFILGYLSNDGKKWEISLNGHHDYSMQMYDDGLELCTNDGIYLYRGGQLWYCDFEYIVDVDYKFRPYSDCYHTYYSRNNYIQNDYLILGINVLYAVKKIYVDYCKETTVKTISVETGDGAKGFVVKGNILYLLGTAKVFIINLDTKEQQEKQSVLCWKLGSARYISIFAFEDKTYFYSGLNVYETVDFVSYTVAEMPSAVTVKNNSGDDISIHIVGDNLEDGYYIMPCQYDAAELLNNYCEDGQIAVRKEHVLLKLYKNSAQVGHVYFDNMYFEESENNFALILSTSEKEQEE